MSKGKIIVEHGKASRRRGLECWARGPFKKGGKNSESLRWENVAPLGNSITLALLEGTG